MSIIKEELIKALSLLDGDVSECASVMKDVLSELSEEKAYSYKDVAAALLLYTLNKEGNGCPVVEKVERPRAEYSERPRREFNDRDERPRRDFGDRNDRPRNDFGNRDERPRRDFGAPSGDRPRRDFNDRPPRRESDPNSTRFFINVGNSDGIGDRELIDLICSKANIPATALTDVKALDIFSFVNVSNEFKDQVAQIKGERVHKREINVEEAGAKSTRPSRPTTSNRSYVNGERSFEGNRSDAPRGNSYGGGGSSFGGGRPSRPPYGGDSRRSSNGGSFSGGTRRSYSPRGDGPSGGGSGRPSGNPRNSF